MDAGVSHDRITVVRNGVDTNRFSPPADRREDDGITRFVHPARILPGKGQHLAIDAVARLRAPKASSRAACGGVGDGQGLPRPSSGAVLQPERRVPPGCAGYGASCPRCGRDSVSIRDGRGFWIDGRRGYGVWRSRHLGRPAGNDDRRYRCPCARWRCRGPSGSDEGSDGLARRAATTGKAGREWVERRYSWEGVWVQYEQVLANAKGADPKVDPDCERVGHNAVQLDAQETRPHTTSICEFDWDRHGRCVAWVQH